MTLSEEELREVCVTRQMASFAADMLVLYINGTNKSAIDELLGADVKLSGAINADMSDPRMQSMMLTMSLLEAAKDWLKHEQETLSQIGGDEA